MAKRKRNNIVMTSDFCITLKKGNSTQDVIRTAKYKKELIDRRVMEKFHIEEKYWDRHGLDWGIVTEEEIDKIYSQNLSDILDYLYCCLSKFTEERRSTTQRQS